MFFNLSSFTHAYDHVHIASMQGTTPFKHEVGGSLCNPKSTLSVCTYL
jgi:hypothetical protein